MVINKVFTPQSLPIKILVWIVIMVTILFMFEVWYIWKTYELQGLTISRNFQLLDLSGTIVHLEEVLSMSTRLAVQTGEKRWQERYYQYKPKLDAAIREVRILAPDIFISTNAMWLESANNKLESMDKMAFEFVDANRKNDADVLLNSSGYEEQKKIYSSGIEEIALVVKRQTAASLNSVRRWLFFSVGTAVVALSVLLFILSRILYLLSDYESWNS
jgi:hypothetical protein